MYRKYLGHVWIRIHAHIEGMEKVLEYGNMGMPAIEELFMTDRTSKDFLSITHNLVRLRLQVKTN